ncbi:MAG: tetratricopeptide repeat protein [Chitinophagaceae bacterium]|nr:tetratricopeptide repeat protein [Chitinophagaceae bacterium]
MSFQLINRNEFLNNRGLCSPLPALQRGAEGELVQKSLRIFIIFLSSFISLHSFSQTAEIVKGNNYYKDSAFDKAEEYYRKSINKKPTPAAQYNLGNTLYKKQKEATGEQTEAIIKSFDEAATDTTDAEVKAKALYNKGVVYHKNNQVDEAINAYKEALRLTPGDAEIRKNLQIALQNKRKQNPEQQQKPKPQEQPKEQKDKKQEQPPPPPPKLSKKQAEQYLKSLTEKEKQLQEKMQKKVGVPSQPDKDW